MIADRADMYRQGIEGLMQRFAGAGFEISLVRKAPGTPTPFSYRGRRDAALGTVQK
jgi:hypothetical protein